MKHAGDLLEDLGHGRDTELERLRMYPLGPFRTTHAYGNFGRDRGPASGKMSWSSQPQSRT